MIHIDSTSELLKENENDDTDIDKFNLSSRFLSPSKCKFKSVPTALKECFKVYQMEKDDWSRTTSVLRAKIEDFKNRLSSAEKERIGFMAKGKLYSDKCDKQHKTIESLNKTIDLLKKENEQDCDKCAILQEQVSNLNSQNKSIIEKLNTEILLLKEPKNCINCTNLQTQVSDLQATKQFYETLLLRQNITNTSFVTSNNENVCDKLDHGDNNAINSKIITEEKKQLEILKSKKKNEIANVIVPDTNVSSPFDLIIPNTLSQSTVEDTLVLKTPNKSFTVETKSPLRRSPRICDVKKAIDVGKISPLVSQEDIIPASPKYIAKHIMKDKYSSNNVSNSKKENKSNPIQENVNISSEKINNECENVEKLVINPNTENFDDTIMGESFISPRLKSDEELNKFDVVDSYSTSTCGERINNSQEVFPKDIVDISVKGICNDVNDTIEGDTCTDTLENDDEVLTFPDTSNRFRGIGESNVKRYTNKNKFKKKRKAVVDETTKNINKNVTPKRTRKTSQDKSPIKRVTRQSSTIDILNKKSPINEQKTPNKNNIVEDIEKLMKQKSPEFPYVGACRKKEERMNLISTACPQCETYFTHLSPTTRAKRLQNACRHKTRFTRPKTPEDYWKTNFPDTEECEEKGYLLTTQSKPSKHRRKKQFKQLFDDKNGSKNS